MGRPHRRGTDADLDPYQSSGYQYDRPDSYDDAYPSRGRSPGPSRRNRSVPAAAPAASYDDYDRDTGLREPRESRKHRKERKEPAAAPPPPDDYPAPQAEPRRERKSHKSRSYHDEDLDDRAYAKHSRGHARSAGGAYRPARDDDGEFDAYAPASRRGRERQHAYHPPRTAETRRSKYPDYDAEPRSERRRSRHGDYDAEPLRSRYPDHDYDEPRDRRRSRHAEYEGRGGDPHRSRYPDHDYDAVPRSRGREHGSGRGKYRNDSPGRYENTTRQRSTRGRSMPRNAAVGGAAAGARPRAKSAVGYAAFGEAAQTAFRVGSQAAYQMRKEPGPWIGEKGTKVATAALGAALVDTFVGHKASGMKGGMRHQALRQACEMGIRNFVMQPAVNSASRHYSDAPGGSSGRRRR